MLHARMYCSTSSAVAHERAVERNARPSALYAATSHTTRFTIFLRYTMSRTTAHDFTAVMRGAISPHWTTPPSTVTHFDTDDGLFDAARCAYVLFTIDVHLLSSAHITACSSASSVAEAAVIIIPRSTSQAFLLLVLGTGLPIRHARHICTAGACRHFLIIIHTARPALVQISRSPSQVETMRGMLYSWHSHFPSPVPRGDDVGATI